MVSPYKLDTIVCHKLSYQNYCCNIKAEYKTAHLHAVFCHMKHISNLQNAQVSSYCKQDYVATLGNHIILVREVRMYIIRIF